ncbi:MAG: PPOX class F420-dependent oxidoreductase [Chloroflexi bacterium]|nr:PPOX class F420-dependent oxidoreductase [Chloroflexota bacterium]
MPAKLTAAHKRFFTQANIGHLATLMEDGSPQVTPVWLDLERNTILVNTTDEQQKTLNVARDPRVAISAVDTKDPYDAIYVRGRVIERRHKGAEAHIHKLSRGILERGSFPGEAPARFASSSSSARKRSASSNDGYCASSLSARMRSTRYGSA